MICNLHTHTDFCDGKNTPLEMVESAINLGLDTLGFSGHSPLLGLFWTMRDEVGYFDRINALKREFEGKINILCGLELDIFSKKPELSYDYTIGSVHLVKCGEEYFDVDRSRDYSINLINEHFSGSFIKLAKAYFELASVCPKVTNCDIVGHFDLLTKFDGLIDEDNKEYRKIALEALLEASKQNKPFEINTGALARGNNKIYPSLFLLKELKNIGGKVIITTDCHSADSLNTGYDMAVEILKEAGFNSHIVYKNKKIEEVGFDV